MEKCKKCSSADTYKNGLVRGKQRYKCNTCGLNFTLGDRRNLRAKKQEIKDLAIQLYQLGLGFRAIGKFLGVSNVSVLNWVKKAGNHLPKIDLPLSVRVMELDEMWHYCKKKEKKFGAGSPFVVIQSNCLPSNSEQED